MASETKQEIISNSENSNATIVPEYTELVYTDAAKKAAPNQLNVASKQFEGQISVSTPAGSSQEPTQWSDINQKPNKNTNVKSVKESESSLDIQQKICLKEEFISNSKIDDPYHCNEQVGTLLVERITFEEPCVIDNHLINAHASQAQGNDANENVDDLEAPTAKRKKTGIFTKDDGPSLYMVKGELVTPPIITKNLPEEFASFPIYGHPKSKDHFPEFFKDKIRDFMGPDLTDEEFDNLAKYCSPCHLKTGVEINMPTGFPTHGFVTAKHNEKAALEKAASVDGINLCIQKKLQLRMEKDVNNMFPLKLKYRGIRMIPLAEDEKNTPTVMIGKPLEPGKDLVFRVRVYRPYAYNLKYLKGRTRHSVFSCDIVMVGRQKLSLLRDRIVCANDVGMRVDVSNNPDELPATSAKDVFPSGFLFINNVFYVDSRAGCVDHSAGLRAWAARRGLGEFPVRDMCAVRLDEILIKLGHPEVYMHQGNCEHLFTFSEVRLLGARDPPRLSAYPAHSAVSQHQSVYCTTCAEFGAKWIVVACDRVPFDPAFFCDTCFKLYLYADGRKIGDFKAYSYRGNELNMLKPQG